MNNLDAVITDLRKNFDAALAGAQDVKAFDEIKVKFLGKKGLVQDLLGGIKDFTVEEKRSFGQRINELKAHCEAALEEARIAFTARKAQESIVRQQHFDVTASLTGMAQGHLHPYTQVTEDIENIFISMGYEVLDGPELETDFYNFTALNIPQDHPARDMYDTFWVDKATMLMRTHTSPVQVRTMQSRELPIAAIVPGRTFRHEAVDASHDFQFMQCEGFFIDKNVNMSHLLATAQTFLKKLFNKDSLDIRIRPGFFPFVEPGVEIDMRCPFCKDGCSTCKKSTWMEVFPGGLIHPNVLRAGGIDPQVYSGFAFGFGLSRLVMLKYGIDDIRYLYGGKMKFLEQF